MSDKMRCASYGPPPPTSTEGAQGGATPPTEPPPKTETHPPPAPGPSECSVRREDYRPMYEFTRSPVRDLPLSFDGTLAPGPDGATIPPPPPAEPTQPSSELGAEGHQGRSSVALVVRGFDEELGQMLEKQGAFAEFKNGKVRIAPHRPLNATELPPLATFDWFIQHAPDWYLLHAPSYEQELRAALDGAPTKIADDGKVEITGPVPPAEQNPPPRAPYSSSTTKREPLWALLDELRAEILRQENGIGSARDPYRLLPNDWISLLVGLLGRTSDASTPDVRRRRLLQVAAVALAAIRAMDR